MFTLKCDYCGYEQKVKKRLDSETCSQRDGSFLRLQYKRLEREK